MPSRFAAIFFGIVVYACLPWYAVSAAQQAGEVVAVGGECFIEVDGKRSSLKLGDAVHVGDSVIASAGAKLKLRMNDGSILSAASGTRVAIQAYEVDSAGQQRDAKLSLASGLLRAVVSTLSKPSKFEVETATGVAAVRGTDWFVEVQQNATQVGVLTGSVQLTSLSTQKAVSIPARWGARLEAGMNPVPSRVWSQAEFDAVIARTDVK
jgi:hypothetical protein